MTNRPRSPLLPLLYSLLLGACASGVPGFGGEFAIEPERVTLQEGDTAQLRLAARNAAGAVWESADTTVIRVVGPGRLAAVGLGRSLITARHGGREARAYVYVDRSVLVGAGDIGVCGYQADEATAALLDNISGLVWTAGDNAYPSGTDRDFRECYSPSWGRHRERTRPTPGNHEYRTPDAEGYFDYFGELAGERGKGWYSYRYGGWLVLALNSNFSAIGPERVEEQLRWLEEQLEEQPTLCTVAYFHHPLFSSGSHGNNEDAFDDENVRPFWDLLYEAGADVVLVGHDHHYERFAPLTPMGELDRERGIRQFLVGTGGGPLRGQGPVIHPHSEVFVNTRHGVLELVLHDDGYEWQFVAIDGDGVDSGRDRCH